MNKKLKTREEFLKDPRFKVKSLSNVWWVDCPHCKKVILMSGLEDEKILKKWREQK